MNSAHSHLFSTRARLRLSSPWVAYLTLAVDMGVITSVAVLAYGFYLGAYLLPHQMPPTYQLLVAAPLVLLVFQFDRLYRSWRLSHMLTMLWTVSNVWVGILLVEVVLLFLSKSTTEVSRVWFLMYGGGALLGLNLVRLIAYYALSLLRMRGYNYRSLLIVGQGPTSDEVVRVIEASAFSGFRVVGRVQPEDLADYLASEHQAPPQEVWLCLPLSDERSVKVALEALGHSTANIRLIPDWFSLRLMNHGMSERLGIPMLDISTATLSGMSGLIKAIEDKVLATLILIFISPLMVLIALAIKISMGGPVLFKQMRHGWNGRLINVYKFRTMVLHDAPNGEVVQATPNDHRVTPLGGFLRRTSLDELPQFINVLQGKMSIVGPRPHAVAHNEHYKEFVPRYMLRHKVKPGITGWAQVNGFRGEIDRIEKMERRVELDLYYIENMSLWFDLKIIFLTVFKGFVHRNAY
jgi:putative colanic acid biosynthesis UDP-glucose lipid carrier transferase